MSIFGQHNVGLKINCGFSRVSNPIDFYNQQATYTHSVQFAPSGYVGLYYNLQIDKKSYAGLETIFSQVEGKEKIENIYTDTTGSSTDLTSNIYKHISYLGFPIYFCMKFNDWIINAGFQVSFVMSSSAKENAPQIVNGNLSYIDNKYDKLYIDSYDYGPRVGLSYYLSDKFSINGSYYFGLNNINSGGSSMTWKVQQISVGLSYTFFNKMKNDIDNKQVLIE